jgi:thiol reductant ABC exporter CydC subunit
MGLMAVSAYIISAAALQPSIAVLQVPIVGVRFFGISRGLFRYLERYVSHDVTFRLLSQLRIQFYTALEPLAPARFLQFQSGDLLTRLIKGINTLEIFYVRVVAPPLIALLVMIFSGLFLASYAPLLTITISIFWIALGIGVPILVHNLSRRTGQEIVIQRTAMNNTLIDGIQGMPDIQAFDATSIYNERASLVSQKLAKTETQLALINGIQTSLGVLLTNLGAWMVLILSIQLVNQEQIEGIYLASLVLVALTSFEAVLPLPDAARYLEISLEAARRLFHVVDTEPEVKDSASPIQLSYSPRKLVLDVRNLWFRYPTDAKSAQQNVQNPYVLENISFSLQPGNRLAVVGPSGAGKTTLINLLLRFWEYKDGEILLGGKDIRIYNQNDVRRLISVVSQHTYLFNTTVRENLLIAKPNAKDSELIQVAKKAQIHEFIQSLPNGYDTWIGEQGYLLSGGERQRLAIARALLKSAPLLILDEAIANLDARTEQQVLKAIRDLMEERTTLMITHRMTMLEIMNEIIVLDRGKIVERNTHQVLLEREGMYKHMWNLQHNFIDDPFHCQT